jgi:hypothetical protein
MTKELKLNDQVIAHYEIDRDILFLKVRVNTKTSREIGSIEDSIAILISVYENRKFKGLAYLNIP